MKTTSIRTLAAAASLTVLFASYLFTQDAWISTAVFAATVATLIALHDYAPRKYFVVTTQRSSGVSGPKAVSRFPVPRVTPRRQPVKRSVSLAA